MKTALLLIITTSWLLAMGPGGGMGRMYGHGMNAGEAYGDFSQNRQRFRYIDQNQDGKISRDEWEKMRQERLQKRSQENKQFQNAQNIPSFETIDSNGDGFIDRKEMREFQMQRRKHADFAR